MAKHTQLGQKGEEVAVDYLLRNGYEILVRNYRFQKAEVDIIARTDEFLVVVEVKTRSTADFGDPQDFLKPRQIKRLVNAVDNYMDIHDIDLEVRFDIIAIINKNRTYEVTHLIDAFYHF